MESRIVDEQNGDALVLSPALGYIKDDNVRLYDNGHDYLTGMVDVFADDTVVELVLKKAGLARNIDDLQTLALERDSLVFNSIRNQEYSLIVTTTRFESRYLDALEEAGYYADMQTVRTGNQYWEVHIWYKG